MMWDDEVVVISNGRYTAVPLALLCINSRFFNSIITSIIWNFGGLSPITPMKSRVKFP